MKKLYWVQTAALGLSLLGVPALSQQNSSAQPQLAANAQPQQTADQPAKADTPKPDIMDNTSPNVLYDPIWKSFKEKDPIQISGFLQTRIADYKNSSGDRYPTHAEITRLRPTVSYIPNEFWDFHVQFDITTRGRPANSVTGRDVYVDYHNKDYFVRGGQAKVPVGYEEWQESDEDRATLERARVLTTLFPNERDTGFWVGTVEPRDPNDPDKKARLVRPTYILAVLTGNGIDKYYDDEGKVIAARVRIPWHKDVAFDISMFTGRSNESNHVERVKQAFDLAAQGKKGRVAGQVEYLWGRNAGANVYGGYEQVSYDTKKPGVFFVKHDIFDPNTSGAGKMWNRESLGLYKDIGHFRVTGEYDIVENAAVKGNVNTFGFQFQMKY